MGKKNIATKVDPPFAKEFEDLADEKGISVSELMRRAAREYLKNNNGNGTDVWKHVPPGLRPQIRKLFKAIRDYQHVNQQNPLNFSIKAREGWDGTPHIPNIEEVLRMKWSSKIDKHKEKVHKASKFKLFRVEWTEEWLATKMKGELRLSERGKNLMRTIEGGDFDPSEHGDQLDNTDSDDVDEDVEQTQQKTLGVKP